MWDVSSVNRMIVLWRRVRKLFEHWNSSLKDSKRCTTTSSYRNRRVIKWTTELRPWKRYEIISYLSNCIASLELAQLSFETELFGADDSSRKNCESCDRLADELAKLKRLLAYERNANDGLRKAFFELRQNSEDEIKSGSFVVYFILIPFLLINTLYFTLLTIEKLHSTQLKRDLEHQLTVSFEQKVQLEKLTVSQANYKEQLEKTETKLNDANL